ncbi:MULTISPECIES: Abi-alpha family protein [Sphingobacterium]|uniref:Abi-alpha family protein n=1 Tax=Sphingobacterium TaxID=28453 RepID=UPI0025808F6C|nr:MULTISPECIES: Abi-alpha family protein [Sphingobacterium]
MNKKKENLTTDLLGVAPYGEAIKVAVEKGFGGAKAILSRVCLPAAEELGLMYKDKVRHWRLNNIIKIIEKSDKKIDFVNGNLELTAHPRVIKEIIENGSWCDDDSIQEMWAGILASSCNEKLGDDSNLIFVNALKNLTKNQVIILNYICQNCKIKVDRNGFLFAEHIEISFEDLCAILDTSNLHQIDSELDNLASNELILQELNVFGGGHAAGFVFGDDKITAHLEPSPFAINLFIKGQGFKGEPKDYFKIDYIETNTGQK